MYNTTSLSPIFFYFRNPYKAFSYTLCLNVSIWYIFQNINTNTRNMKILLADDHALIRAGVRALVKSFNNVQEIEEAKNGPETLNKIRDENFDMVILDIFMSGANGLDILRQAKKIKKDTRFLIISSKPEEVFAKKVFKLGASGYLPKCAPVEEIKKAIKKVMEGGKYMSDKAAESIVFNNQTHLPHEMLSDREFQVFLLLAEGKKVKEIADILFISDKTVSTHRARIMQKMSLKTNVAIALYATDNNLIT